MAQSILTKYKQRRDSVDEDVGELRARLRHDENRSTYDPPALPAYLDPVYEQLPPTAEEPDALSPWDLLVMVREGWWIVALTTLAAFAVSLLSLYLATPLYESSAQIIMSANPELEGSQAAYIQSELEKRFTLSTIAELLDSNRIYNEIGAMLQLSPELLEQYERNTVVLPETTILEHTVTGPDPEVAAVLANSIGQRTIEFVKDKYQPYDAAFLNVAEPNPEAVSPQPIQSLSLALGLGLMLGIGMAVARGFLTSDKALGLPWSAARGAGGASADTIELLDGELARAPVYPLSLALLHFDGSPQGKPLSDGNQVALREQAETVLRRELRGKDLVLPVDARTIAILLPDVPGGKAERALSHMRLLLLEAVAPTAGMAEIRLGVTERHGEESAAELIDQARQALAQARQNGLMAARFAPVAEAGWSE